ncbi:MAG TPA: hypothetical protein PKD10_06975 [Paracoccaceae bacterium]|nr:hypothetical protein [Paracoccaceae bacterium]HMO70992.1 hypothetical protein [Paracoccaceae bacterium]
MAAKKAPVAIDTIGVGKVFDKKVAEDGAEAIGKALGKVIGGSGKLALERKVPKGEKGFDVSGTIKELTFDDGVLAGKLSLQVNLMPERKMFAMLEGGGKVDGVKPAKVGEAMADLAAAMAESAGGKARKAMEAKAGDL